MKPDCIILAAGLSSRMNEWKLLLPFHGKSVIKQVIENASEHCGKIIISGGYRFDELKSHLREYKSVRIINNTHYEQGMMSSLQAAAGAVNSEYFFVSLGDMPLLTPDIYNQMALNKPEDVLLPTFEGKTGHPVLINSSLITAILKAKSTVRIKTFLSKYNIDTIRIENQNIFRDIDTVEDYKKLTFRK